MTIYKNIEELINNEAPHGSGIDYDYTNFKKYGRQKVTFENAFHVMDEYGYYDCIVPFKVTIDKYNDVKINFIGLNNHGRYMVKKTYLREYLEDTYANFVQSAIARYSLEEILK